jgi:hypothetical protein
MSLRFRVLVAGVAGLALAASGQGVAASHTVPMDGATLAGPALVYLRTSVKTDVVVLEHKTEVTIHSKSFVLPMGSGSGVVVNPSGTVATAASVVATDLATAKIDAVNRLFGAVHKVRIGDPRKKQRLRDPALNAKLRNCYGNGSHRECIVINQTQVIEVFPWAQPPFPHLTGEVLTTSKGVAVVGISGATNRPSAGLAATDDVAGQLTLLGFSEPPTGKSSPKKTTAASRLQLKGLKIPAGSNGGPVVDEHGQVVALADAPGAGGNGRFLPVTAVAAALEAAKAQPQRGVVDNEFEEAIRYYNQSHDQHAVDRFDRVLQLYPRHVEAQRLLADARTKAGSKEDMSGGMDEHPMAASSPPFRLWAIAGGIALLVLAAAALLWRRRRHVPPGPAPAAPAPAAGGAPAAAQPTPAQPATPTPAPAGTRTAAPLPAETRTAAPLPAETRTAAPVPAKTATTTRPLAPVTPPVEPVGNGQETGERRGAEPAPTPAKAAGTKRERVAETRVETRLPEASGFAFCTQCGKPSSPGHRFCGYCGNRFG